MNRKQFLVLVIALIVLGGAGIALFQQDIAAYRASGAKIGPCSGLSKTGSASGRAPIRARTSA